VVKTNKAEEKKLAGLTRKSKEVWGHPPRSQETFARILDCNAGTEESESSQRTRSSVGDF